VPDAGQRAVGSAVVGDTLGSAVVGDAVVGLDVVGEAVAGLLVVVSGVGHSVITFKWLTTTSAELYHGSPK